MSLAEQCGRYCGILAVHTRRRVGGLYSPITVLVLAFLVRMVAITVGDLYELNPFSGGQADAYARQAELAAHNIREGEAVDFQVFGGRTSRRLGPLLAVFWLVPGPNLYYAQVVNAVVATAAIYNVYAITRNLHTRLSGYVVTLPLAFYPSYVLVHSTLQREAVLLFALTLSVLLLRFPPRWLPRAASYAVATLSMGVVVFLRMNNVFIVVPAFVFVVWFTLVRRSGPDGRVLLFMLPTAIVVPAVLTYSDRAIDYVSTIRLRRARGRTVYLEGYAPDTLPEALVFAVVGTVYFLFTPFPWMVENGYDAVVAVESLVSLVFAVFAGYGAVAAYERSPVFTASLIVGLVLGSVAFGLGTANIGTAVRHRQALLWILFVLGSIGICERFRSWDIGR